MRRVKLWQAEGTLRHLGPDGTRDKTGRPSRRTVQFEAVDFNDAAAHAQEALLANWSRVPHEAEVLRVQPVIDNDGDQFVVYVREAPELRQEDS